MKTKKFLTLMLCAFLILSVFAGCSGSKEESKPETKTEGATKTDTPKTDAATTDTTKTEQTTTASNDPQPGGIATFAYTQPFKGFLEAGLYEGQDDSLILAFMQDAMFRTGDDLKTYPNLAEWTESPDHKVFTFKIKQGVKWQNGDELTAEDWRFALYVLADKDYTGKRFSNVQMIKGVQEYHDGKAKEITGIKVIDTYTLEVTVNNAAVNTLDNLWSYPMPSKYYAGIPIKDLVNNEKVRKNPIGLGPFKVKKVQPGEFVELERYDGYWQGKPLLDGVVFKVIDGALTTSLLKNGEIDIVQIPNSQYLEAQKLNNVELMKTDSLSYSYIAFKLGKWDKKKKQIIMDNPKFADKRFRQAIAYAIDRQGLLDAFSNGLGTILNAPMPTVSWAKIPDSELNKYPYDPEKAKQLLDEAGFKDINGDGLREDPKGQKFTVNFDAMSGSEISEPRAQAVLQYLKDVGIEAKLNGGGLKEMNTFYEGVEKDHPSVEMFMGAWSLASDPDPTGLWKTNDEWNFPRWVNAESDKLIDEGIGEKSFDQEYRKQVYFKWQKLVNEELPMIFLNAPQDVYAVNKRLQGVHLNSFTAQNDTHKWWIKK